MKSVHLPALVLLGCLPCVDGGAYETNTHAEMAVEALRNSELNSAGYLKRLGFVTASSINPIEKFDFPVPEPKGKFSRSIPIVDLVRRGAIWEDDRADSQALYHFFNPLTGDGIDVDPLHPRTTSPDWILEDGSTYLTQPFSLRDAKEYFYQALVSKQEGTSVKNWGALFQAIGHVIHHVQDMAQPQHVRDDIHCKFPECEGFRALVGQERFKWNPSRYEHWTSEITDKDQLDQLWRGYEPVFSSSRAKDFLRVRDFWTTSAAGDTSGIGIAEFTNRNFFSENTVYPLAGSLFPYGGPALPEPVVFDSSSVSLGTLCGLDLTGCDFLPMSSRPEDQVTFFSTRVHDSLRGTVSINTRAASTSLFDDFILRLLKRRQVGSNPFTFLESARSLVPRAVAYSTGIINFIFRARLDVSAPKPYGVVGVVDARPETVGEAQGFSSLRVALRNETPAITVNDALIEQDMLKGKLVAVARFSRDTSMQQDAATGTYLRSPAGSDIVAMSIETVMSAEVVVEPGGAVQIPRSGEEPVNVTFVFDDANRIPINAIDLTLQVVYRGELGAEADVIAVDTIDLSEPTMVVVSNDHDYYWSESAARWVSDPNVSANTSDGQLVFTLDAVRPASLSGIPQPDPIPPGQFAAVWVLVDVENPPRYGASFCPSCGFDLFPLRMRRVVAESSGAGVPENIEALPPLAHQFRGFWMDDGVGFYGSLPAGCETMTLRDCFDSYEHPDFVNQVPTVNLH